MINTHKKSTDVNNVLSNHRFYHVKKTSQNNNKNKKRIMEIIKIMKNKMKQ